MPAHEIECPVCFATLKLKAPPKPGAKLKCPKCSGVFSPGGEPESLVAAETEDDLEDEIPTSRPKGRVAGKAKKKKSKPFNWQVPVVVGGILATLIAVAVGLYLARDVLFPAHPTVDLAYCQLDKPAMLVELRPPEFLQSTALPQDVRTGPGIANSSKSLQELMGVELKDLELVQAQVAVTAGFNPMMPANPGEQLIVLKSRKPITRPTSESVLVEGVACYYVHADPPSPDFQNTTSMFFPNSSTAVLGSESTVRALLGKWKAKTPPAPLNFTSPGDTIVMFFGESFVRDTVQSLSNAQANPMMMMVAGPQAGPDEDFKRAGEVLQANATGFSLSLKCTSEISLNIAVHGKDTNGAKQLQTMLEGLRTKLQGMLQNLSAMAALMPPDNQEQLKVAEQVLAKPVAATGDRVSIAIPLPAKMQSDALQGLTKNSPVLLGLKLGRAGSASPGATATPAMSPGAHASPGASHAPAAMPAMPAAPGQN